MLRAASARAASSVAHVPLEVWRLGKVDYLDAWALQRCLHAQRAGAAVARQRGEPAGDFPNVLLVLEHPSVYTMGRGASALGLNFDPRPLLGASGGQVISDEVKAHLDGLAAEPSASGVRYADGGRFSLHRCDRGGQITWHGPGQVVAYPVLDLGAPGGPFAKDLAAYVHGLEDAVIGALDVVGVPASRMEGYPGVWTEGGRKVAALGASASRWVTLHGLSVNVDCDLAAFARITPCGIEGRGVTSVAEELLARGEEPPSVDEVADAVVASFESVFRVPCADVSEGVLPLDEAFQRAGGTDAVAAQRQDILSACAPGGRFDVLRAGTSRSGDIREQR